MTDRIEFADSTAPPKAGRWLQIDSELRAAFTGCPELPRMTKRISQMRREAAHHALLHGPSTAPMPVCRKPDRSFITAAPIHLALSREDTPDNPAYLDAPTARWHLSISLIVGGQRHPASDTELTGWILAGFPEASRVATYTLTDGVAIHADIPIDPVST